MSARDLFKKSDLVISHKSLSDITSTFGFQNSGVVSGSFKEYDRLLPNVDFSKPETFCKFSSAELLYSQSITNICLNYPIDGSKKEKIEWRNNASYLDNYIFDYKYPKHTGSISIGNSFGTVTDNIGGLYRTPSSLEYIRINQGLNTGTKYNSTNRQSAFSFDYDSGFCVEFWYRNNGAIYVTGTEVTGSQLLFQFKNDAGFLTNNSYCMYAYYQNLTTTIAITSGSYGYSTTHSNSRFAVGNWNHFCINVSTSSSNGYGTVDFWVNGHKEISSSVFTSSAGNKDMWPHDDVPNRFSGSIGSWFADFGVYGPGSCKTSGSFDDFRFWRKARTDREITSNWFCSVDGGYETDEQLDPDMGFYYKFNELTLGTSSIDACVIDYSGRRNHGTWIGYVSGSRLDYSPMENEIPDIINHISASRVQELMTSSALIGRAYDVNNNGSFLNLSPGFLSDQDESGDFTKLTQILAAMFDRMWLQINNLTSLKDSSYFQSGSSSTDIIMKAINSSGLEIPSILDAYSLKELISNKSDTYSFEKSIEKVKQTIYKNIHANLIYIFKSKGTEKSLRSIFRAFGVDDEILKIKAYSDNSSIEIDGDKRIDTIRRKNFLDLSGKNDYGNMNGVIFNHYISVDTASIPFETSSTETNCRKTIETTILFPDKPSEYDSNYIPFLDSNLSASLFGFNQVTPTLTNTSLDSTFKVGGFKMNVFAVQKSKQSKDAKFVFYLSSSNINTIYTETNWYPNVYNNSKWTFGVRFFNSGTNIFPNNLGLSNNITNILTQSFNVYAINELSNNIIHTISFQQDLYQTSTTRDSEFYGKTKFYIGANRTNFTGTVLNPTQAKFAYLRVWNDYIQDEDIINHALDVHNYGVYSSTWNMTSYPNVDRSYDLDLNFVPKMESLLLNWDFENNYTPNSLGIFTVSSLRSNSIYSGGLDNSIAQSRYRIPIGPNYTAIGYGFNSGAIVVDKNYVIEQKNRVATDYYSYEDISLVDDNEKYFGRAIKPQQYFFTVENSIYSVISEDMLNMFSSINEFNNLYGHSTDYYRNEYKTMKTIRRLFFSKLQNLKIDHEKYFSYYKWIDSAISILVKQLIPFSINSDGIVKNIIESHVLEMNKYTWCSYDFITRRQLAPITGTIINAGLKKPYRPPT